MQLLHPYVCKSRNKILMQIQKQNHYKNPETKYLRKSRTKIITPIPKQASKELFANEKTCICHIQSGHIHRAQWPLHAQTPPYCQSSQLLHHLIIASRKNSGILQSRIIQSSSTVFATLYICQENQLKKGSAEKWPCMS